jgi:hypothetical protein
VLDVPGHYIKRGITAKGQIGQTLGMHAVYQQPQQCHKITEVLFHSILPVNIDGPTANNRESLLKKRIHFRVLGCQRIKCCPDKS